MPRTLDMPRPSTVYFGPFRLDLVAGEVEQGDRRVRLQEQPLQILTLLIASPGEVVTREEIRKTLWPDDTVVEFDHSINSALKKLRNALGDFADEPQFIETVARRGYRLIVPVTYAETAPLGLAQLSDAMSLRNPSAVAAPQIEVAEPDAFRDEPPKNLRGWRRLSVAAAIIGVALCATVAWYKFRPLPTLRISKYTQITHDGAPRSIGGTDGNRIYFTRWTSPQRIEQVSARGGEVEEIPIPLPNPYLMDVSQDGTSLLLTFPNALHPSWPLWSLPTAGGPLRRVGAFEVKTANLTSDGASLIYTSGENDIFITGREGSDARKLTSVGRCLERVSWSPDGKSFRFCRSDGLLWELSLSESTPHLVHPNWRPATYECGGTWTADGNFFVSGTDGQLQAFDERRSRWRNPPEKPIQLTSGPMSWGLPTLSKDGRILAQGQTAVGELIRFDAQTKTLQPFLGGISAVEADFSPNGKEVAYVSFPDRILWRQNLDGSGKVQLSDSSMVPYFPRWSPNGSEIVFQNIERSQKLDLPNSYVKAFVVSREGGNPRRIIPDTPENQTDPNWSPDGRKIVYAGFPHYIIRILDVESHQIVTLPDSAHMWLPSWSPNGKYISAVSEDGTTLKIFDLETQQWRILERQGVSAPAWSWDSKTIYFTRWSTDRGLYRVNIRDNKLERVDDLKGLTPLDTGRMRLDPSGAPLLSRDKSTSNIYALTLEEK